MVDKMEVLRHFVRYSPKEPPSNIYGYTIELTAGGVTEVFGCTRLSIDGALRKLQVQGLIEFVAHVRVNGAKKTRKVYVATLKGRGKVERGEETE